VFIPIRDENRSQTTPHITRILILVNVIVFMELAVPTLGASGAISGVMGAYIVMYPRARIRTLILAYFIAVVSVPAVFFLGFWFLLQLLYTWVDIGGGVAYWAHIGGFVAGMVLALIVRRRKKKRLKPVIPCYMETQI
jgi:membrane associated rhomboid family serine protease